MDILKLYVQALEAMKKRAMTTHGFGHLVVNAFHLLTIGILKVVNLMEILNIVWPCGSKETIGKKLSKNSDQFSLSYIHSMPV